MNKILFIVARATVIAVLCAFFVASANAKAVNPSYTEVSKSDLKQRIESLNSAVDLRYSNEVHKLINNYIKRYRRGSERLLGLSEQFFPLYEAEFNKQGLPEELKYLSIVESGLKPKAISVSGAVGLWQFMKGTGRLYGLRINSAVDERRDPIKSTQAASQYLRDLHEQFGDWTLALAAYNCGPGNLRKALRHSQEEEFWGMKVRGYLPKETRRYIPKYVAISYMMNYSDAHNLTPEYNEATNLATVRVYDYTPFSVISKLTGLDRATISEYNPSFLKRYIPKSTRGYYLTLPQKDLYFYLSQVGGFENLLDLGYDASRLRGRYMLYGAMKRTMNEVSSLTKDIGVYEISSLKTSPLNLPVRLPFEATQNNQRVVYRGRTHKLRSQESLLDVARTYKIKLASLMAMNKINRNAPLKTGAILRLE